MASFRKSVLCKYGIATYQETKDTYDWIIMAVQSMHLDSPTFEEKICFQTGEITCSCESISEFTEHAYGAEKYSLSSMDVVIRMANKESIYFYVHSDGTMGIHTNSKQMLEKIVSALDRTSLSNSKQDSDVSVVYNAPVVIGDKNIIGSGNTVTSISDSIESEKSRIKHSGIIQGVLGNWAWWINRTYCCKRFSLLRA